jgi:hypothetical protein
VDSHLSTARRSQLPLFGLLAFLALAFAVGCL